MGADSVSAVVEAFAGHLAERGLAVLRRDTHISVILLAGDHAWKFRKPVDFGFLDFSTPAARQASCEREVALNARLAPGLYLGVEAIAGIEGAPAEPAVKMRRFDERELLSAQLDRGPLEAPRASALQTFVAELHREAAAAPPARGTSREVHEQAEAALLGIAPGLLDGGLQVRLAACLERTHGALVMRHAQGHIRDCHGDLHAANVVWRDGHWQAFDCIEFNDALRFIDPASDLAFLLMDLEHRGHALLAHRLLDAWLTATGDFDALAVLPLYRAYRALVRAKVWCLGVASAAPSQQLAAHREASALLALAERHLALPPQPTLVITHGVAASGKSSQARQLVETAGMVHLRADFERRRIAGLPLQARSNSAYGAGLYTGNHSRATYARLASAAVSALLAGQSVVVDATFLYRAQRQHFHHLARLCGAAFRIKACEAPEGVLRERLRHRAADGRDPSEATEDVVARQLAAREPLGPEERACVF